PRAACSARLLRVPTPLRAPASLVLQSLMPLLDQFPTSNSAKRVWARPHSTAPGPGPLADREGHLLGVGLSEVIHGLDLGLVGARSQILRQRRAPQVWARLRHIAAGGQVVRRGDPVGELPPLVQRLTLVRLGVLHIEGAGLAVLTGDRHLHRGSTRTTENAAGQVGLPVTQIVLAHRQRIDDRKSTRLNSSHVSRSYAV